MKLYYYKDKHGNFGDDLNPWLWGNLIPDVLDEDEGTRFIGIGTLLNDLIPDQPKKVVFGSGIGYGRELPKIDSRWNFYCVRGPHSAKQLGLSASLAITDPAALVASLNLPPKNPVDGIAFVPHHRSAQNADWKRICDLLGIRYIDPRWPVDRVLGAIGRSSMILTEAMHGAILADSLRVSWAPVIFYDHILESKWLDWCASLAIEYRPSRLPAIWDKDYRYPTKDRLKFKVKRSLASAGIQPYRWAPPPRKSRAREVEIFMSEFSKLIKNVSPILSKDADFDRALSRLLEAVEKLKFDHARGLFT